MSLIPWRERGPLTAVRTDLEKMFENMLGRFDETEIGSQLPEAFRRGPFPALNVSETEKDVVVTAELPGLNEEDIQVELMGNQLSIWGERKWETEKKKKDYHRVESQYGSFRRSVLLPEGLRSDSEAVAATYKKGILEVTIPKVEPTPKTKVKVKGG